MHRRGYSESDSQLPEIVSQNEKFHFGGTNYLTAQFHFHSPSEHMLHERLYPLEAYFVHKSAEGKLLVLGVFFKEGQQNVALQETWNSMQDQKDGEVRIPFSEFFLRDSL